MEKEKIIKKIKNENLLGRSGSMFPVASKWKAVKGNLGEKKFVVCNASEGELETFKDLFLLENFAEEVVKGIKTAGSVLQAEKEYIYLNAGYFEKVKYFLKRAKEEKIDVFSKKGGYIAGEETSIMEAIEGKDPEPRPKPPFPSEKGLWGYPTLVNNVETFYCVTKIVEGKYKRERFYSLSGDVSQKGVFCFSENITVKEILEKTGNSLSDDYFFQVGGGACGEIFTFDEINRSIKGLGSIVVYNRKKTDPYLLMKKWIEFLLLGNCDRCTPCREGLFRIMEMIEQRDFREIEDIFFVMEKTSLCPLGRVAVVPFRSFLSKVLFKDCKKNS